MRAESVVAIAISVLMAGSVAATIYHIHAKDKAQLAAAQYKAGDVVKMRSDGREGIVLYPYTWDAGLKYYVRGKAIDALVYEVELTLVERYSGGQHE